VSLDDVDFAERYRAAWARSGRPERAPEYWDARAAKMRAGVFASEYLRRLVARLNLDGCRTLLDVGCGPGTVALSVAPRLSHVYGLDYSPEMLRAFGEEAAARGIAHATAILRSWDDDWSDLPVCDVVVASRAAAVPDFEAAARKLAARARRRVYLTYPAHGRFIGDEVALHLGRPFGRLPDYLFVVGILHHLGIHPALEFLTDRNRFEGVTDGEEFVARVRAFVGELSAAEADAARGYYEAHGDRLAAEPMRWALFSWEVPRPAGEAGGEGRRG
jgi:SAM-dependent methyltransferase